MFSRTVKPSSRPVSIEIAENLVNKRFYVEISDESAEVHADLPEPDQGALDDVDRFFSSIERDFSGFVFDRGSPRYQHTGTW